MAMETNPVYRYECLMANLVRLSGIRSRDALLATLTEALAQTLPVQSVELFGLVIDADQRFWLPLTQSCAALPVRFVSDPLRIDLDSLAPIASDPERLRCLDRVARVASAPSPQRPNCLTRLPIMLLAGATPWGVAELHSPQPLAEQDIDAAMQLLTVYANILDLLDYSECDALTGLWNRKPFDDLFYKVMPPVEPQAPAAGMEEHRTEPDSDNFYLAMVDIDHFKQVNDTFGHLIGDEVLLLVARILKASFRASDRVYRFGGEEFVIVLRCVSHGAALIAAERFRNNMAEFDFPQAGRITASVGLTKIQAGDLPSSACERADKAVYHAKHHGRNQVCSEADLVRLGLLNADQKVGDIELF
jgi:diguanylate cyclase (GGDEF)-like protein